MFGCASFIVAFIAAIFAVAFKPVHPYEVPAGGDVFAVVAGTWDWEGRAGTCRDNPHTITFSPARDTMILTFAKPIDSTGTQRVARYELRGVTRSGVRGFITDETRTTDSGALVVWDLVLTSRDSYRWHRTDWPPSAYTSEVVRCPAVRARG